MLSFTGYFFLNFFEAVFPEQNPNFFQGKSGRRFLRNYARAGREGKGVWGKENAGSTLAFGKIINFYFLTISNMGVYFATG
jgi:hypothetical protein